ncbi:MAG TPA: PASTA domain-containing protein, partial [candidate division Zixibacteria bacterium]|nr:PASTA domain-containing protein [candidate division Zixibacteria bacterium]
MTDSEKKEKNDFKSKYAARLPAGSWRRRIVHFAVYPLIALLILFFFFDDIVMPLVTRHGSEFELPDIIGYQKEDAVELLKMVDLGLEVTSEEYHPDKPPGTVLSQYPKSGIMVKSGRIIKVVTSIGQKFVKVPQLAGFSVRQAKLNIEAANLILGDVAWT